MTSMLGQMSKHAYCYVPAAFDLLDVEHIAGEIEDVGKSEQRELASRIGCTASHICSSGRINLSCRGASWQKTITGSAQGN
jgi:hypothetical protein